MKSKIFCFNPAVFRKNVVLFWPIWAGYLAILMFVMPLRLWVGLKGDIPQYVINMDPKEYQSTILYTFYTTLSGIHWMGFFTFAMASVTVMALMGFLFSARSTNMMHAFPVTRAELFWTTAISAVAFMAVPELITFLATVLLCLSNGITCVQYVAVWFLLVLLVSILFIAIGMFVSMFTGVMFAVPVFALVINYAYVLVRTAASNVLSMFAYGTTLYSTSVNEKWLFLSPLAFFERNIQFSPVYEATEETKEYIKQYVTGVKVDGIDDIGWYIVMILLFFAFAYYLYQKRPLEKAGDIVAFPVFAPIFRWSVGIVAGFALAMELCVFLERSRVFVSDPIMMVLSMAFGVVAFFIAQMLLQKSFRIWNKKLCKEGILVAFCMMVCFVGFLFGSNKVQNYIPDVNKIEKAQYNISYTVHVEGQEIADVIRLQEEIISHADEWKKETRATYDYSSISLTYTLKNGSKYQRVYRIPLQEDGKKCMEKLCAFEREEKHFLSAMFHDYFENPSRVTGSFDLNYTNYMDFGEETAKTLLAAIKEDAKENTIQKYNAMPPSGNWMDQEVGKYSGYLNFDMPSQESVSYYDNYSNEYYETSAYCSVGFGEDCRHLVEALIQTGLITSEEELILITEYNAMQGWTKDVEIQ